VRSLPVRLSSIRNGIWNLRRDLRERSSPPPSCRLSRRAGHAHLTLGPPHRRTVEIESLFRELYMPLRRYLHRMTGDADAADDAAQEAFVRLAVDGRRMEHPKAWLYTTATNLVRETARTAARRDRLLTIHPVRPADLPRPDEESATSDAVRRVRAVLDRLAPRDRQLLLMREEGFRHAEIAEAIGVAPGSVGTLIARAAKRFADLHGTPEEG
jgi:RNA polymerase sigma factor (sigma-70 family)